MERPGTSHNKLEEAGTCQKQFQKKWNKEKSPSVWATNNIDSVNFYLKIKHSFDSRQRNGLQLKSSPSRKFILSGKLNVKMTPSQVPRVSRAARYRLHR